MLDSLFSRFDHIVVLDTETTGINPKTDEIIEFGAIRVPSGTSTPDVESNLLVRLSPGRTLSPLITDITGITLKQLVTDGVSKEYMGEQLCNLLWCAKPLVIAYNAQFDLNFLYFFLHRLGLEKVLTGIGFLDALTVYKDRRPYPHKLANAVEAYSLHAQNTHRAIDDAKATLELLQAMELECADLEKYVNLFGYNPKYGISGNKISSVRYLPQDYNTAKKLYN
jgi:DNA polymerase-3 subunit epsilon